MVTWKAHEMAVYAIDAWEGNIHEPLHGVVLKAAYP